MNTTDEAVDYKEPEGNMGNFFLPIEDQPRNHGLCKYCDEDIITQHPLAGEMVHLKIGQEIKGQWHTQCYWQAMLNLLLTQKGTKV